METVRMTEELFDARHKAFQVDYRRVVLHRLGRCDLSLMYRLSTLRWNKVERIEAQT
jgi:hypothetical protein